MFYFCSSHSYTQASVSRGDCEPSSPTDFNGHVVKMHQHIPNKAGNRRRYLSRLFVMKLEPYLQKQHHIRKKENSFPSCFAG